ncbi:MAG: sulfatase [Sedimentisphaeraceae bacterium JB056]
MKTRRDFLKMMGAAAAASALPGCMGSGKLASAKRPPNIIFILADDLGNHDLSCCGSELYQTPHIDTLAMDGMYFSNAHAAFPTCAPSRMSIITGKYPARFGCWGHGELGGVIEGDLSLPTEEVTYAEVFRQNGYLTGHIGKWHCGEEGHMPQDQGYDYVYGANDFCCIGSYYYPFQALERHPKARLDLDDLDDADKAKHLTQILSEKVVDFIWENKDKPFMLDYWDYAPHHPLEADSDKLEKYRGLIGPDFKQRNPGYAGLVEHYDEAVGRVLKAVEDAGIADNTIIVFTSDNGGATYCSNDTGKYNDIPITNNYPLRDGKHSQYYGGTRVPAFVRWPGVTKPGSVCDERVIGFDLYPTMLSMASINVPEDIADKIDGKDITSLLKDSDASLEPRALHWLRYPRADRYHEGVEMSKGPCGSILKGDWKLVEFPVTLYGQKQTFELYNVREDISEENNLADKMPGKVQQLKKEMYQWRKEVGAPVDSRQMYNEALKKMEETKQK